MCVHWESPSNLIFPMLIHLQYPPLWQRHMGGWGCSEQSNAFLQHWEQSAAAGLLSAFWSGTPSGSAMFKASSHPFVCQAPSWPYPLAVRAKLIFLPAGCLFGTYDLWRRACQKGAVLFSKPLQVRGFALTCHVCSRISGSYSPFGTANTCALWLALGSEQRTGKGTPAESRRGHCSSALVERSWPNPPSILPPSSRTLEPPMQAISWAPLSPPLLFRNQTPGLESLVGSHSNGPFSCFHGNQHPDHLVASQLTAVSESDSV